MKKYLNFTSKDIEQIETLGLSPQDVKKQLKNYQRGASFLKLNRPCKLDDGIISLGMPQRKKIIERFDTESRNKKILKFVPASGAASRMFDEWFAVVKKKGFGSSSAEKIFFNDLKKMPFYSLVKNDKKGKNFLKQKNIPDLLKFILTDESLNLGGMPKALIPFHIYKDNEVCAAVDEHLFEAAGYLTDSKGICRIHITVSPEYERNLAAKLKQSKNKYESICKVKYKIDLSNQSPTTNIIATDEHNQPLRDEEGKLVFRPGGHGALLKNLNNLDADLIFVKNIDNVVPTKLSAKIIPYKKILGGLALQIKQEIFEVLKIMERKNLRQDQINAIADFCRNKINIVFGPDFQSLSYAQKKKKIFHYLNRPLRVCAMVRNVGEPGGGPFWVDEKNKTQTLQIVEFAHVDKNLSSQRKIWSKASYFNPVDMVCCIKNYQGKKFDLNKFVNHDTFLITKKTEKGRRIKAQEMPGLWNGSMAYWNTVFVEMPLMVFNPVKTVYDLLRPQHQSSTKISLS